MVRARLLAVRLGLLPAEHRAAIWERGERAAARLMRRKRLHVVARNLRLGPGEIDLLCRERSDGVFVIVEVKARLVDNRSNRRPEDAITARKKQKLLTLARTLMRDESVRRAGLRIDVVAVEFERGRRRPVALRHYERAISSS
ncbi:MAG: YraN family protein [Planctomycetota bacterium]